MSKGPISQFIEKHYLHFNSAALVDAAKGYEEHLLDNGKMMITLAGAMSTAELGKSLAEMIRQDKVHIISCTGANLEEDIMNLVAHNSYKRVPNYRDLSPQEEWDLLENHYNRVTDTCIPEEEAFRRLQQHLRKALNFGHTLGHGIESYFLENEDKTNLLHGEAIAVGMILESYISKEKGWLTNEEYHEIKYIINDIFERIEFDENDINQIIELLIYDKKNEFGKVQFALLEGIGKIKINQEVDNELIFKAFEDYAV